MFQYKTILSEANVKTNAMESTKWTYHKERGFTSNCFTFLEILVPFKNILEKVDLMHQQPKYSYSFFSFL